jgi:lysophospholipase L1-like esterase
MLPAPLQCVVCANFLRFRPCKRVGSKPTTATYVFPTNFRAGAACLVIAAMLIAAGCGSSASDAVDATGGTGAGGSTGAAGSPDPGTGGASVSIGGAAGHASFDAGVPGTGGNTGAGGASGTGGQAGARGSGGVAGATGGSPGTGGAAGASGAVPLDPTLLSRCSGTNPIRCTIPVAANGDYAVTVELGDPAAASSSRVQAELLRVVVPTLSLAAGQLSQQTFSVNVRAEVHDGYSAPGMILDLLIDGTAPRLHGLGVAARPNLPTIFVAGDSTVCDWDPAATNILSPIQRGWAQEVSQYFGPGIAVANYADSGETAGSFYSKFFPAARTAMRAGDYLFIQFGHNDQKAQADIDAYQANLMKYISDARARNVTPVLFTPVARRTATAANPGFAGLDQQARDLAAAQNVALVDLTNLAIAYYRTVPDLSLFFATPTEGTHFSESGATQIANLVVQALKTSSLPLKTFER